MYIIIINNSIKILILSNAPLEQRFDEAEVNSLLNLAKKTNVMNILELESKIRMILHAMDEQENLRER